MDEKRWTVKDEIIEELRVSDEQRVKEWMAVLGIPGNQSSRTANIKLIKNALWGPDGPLEDPWIPPDPDMFVPRYSVRLKRIMGIE